MKIFHIVIMPASKEILKLRINNTLVLVYRLCSSHKNPCHWKKVNLKTKLTWHFVYKWRSTRTMKLENLQKWIYAISLGAQKDAV